MAGTIGRSNDRHETFMLYVNAHAKWNLTLRKIVRGGVMRIKRKWRFDDTSRNLALEISNI